MEDFQTFINFGGGIALTAMGWFAKTLWDAVQELKRDLAKLREDLPVFYVRKDDFKDFKEDVMNGLQRILDKLENKVDK
ncbi:MAG: hypothetical protein ACK5PF_04895 [bacterium]|jgi:hypothetical protein